MPWLVQMPSLDWKDDAKNRFFREVWNRLKFGSFTWNPPNVPAASTVDAVLSTSDSDDIAGLRAGMSISVSPPSGLDAGLTCCAFVAADNTLTVRLANVTAGAINPVTGTWAFSGVVN